MSQVRINASIPAGDLEVIVPLHLTIADSGKAQLRDALLEASNRILRVYGKEEITEAQKTQQQEPEQQNRGAHFLREDHNGDPICQCGWDPSRLRGGPKITNREDVRWFIREHIADSKGHRAEGNNSAVTQIRDTSDRNHELNGNDRPGHYGRAISLKWSPRGE